jgi:biofilm PGA synthesis protein PgaA
LFSKHCRLRLVLAVQATLFAGHALAQTHDAHAGTAQADGTGAYGIAHARELRDAGRLTEALLQYEYVLTREPGNADAYRERVLTLADLGNSQLALELMRQRQALFPLHERERIDGDRIARGVVWGATPPVDPAQPHAESAQALADLRQLQQDDPRETTWEATRLRVDALLALNHVQRHQDVVDGYQALLDDSIDVPVYALTAVGDSLLALQRPEEATAVLERVHAHDPQAAQPRILLGYAWMERERFDVALPYFENLAASQLAWPRVEGAKSGYENWDKYSADVNLALAHGFANDTATAERELQALADVGPHNAGLQSTLGGVQAMRLRPQAAMQRYDMALTLDPDLREARLGQTDAWLALDQADRARASYDALRTIYPDDVRLDRLGTELDRYRGWQVRVNAGRGRSEPHAGGTSASPLGSRDGAFGFRVESPLLGERWRIGVDARDDWADFQGERVRYRALGAGASYRYGRLGASAYVTRARDDYDRGATGLDLRADWRWNDAWTSRVGYLRNDPDASLQARRFGITADSVVLGSTWTPSDYTYLDLRATRYRYEDGNRRDALGADLSQRVFSRPHLTVEGLLGASASRASRGDEVPYFNPERDASAAVGLRAEHITWRRYERAFRQRFEATVGPYWQQDYGTHWVPALGYRHIWDLATGSRLEYGIDWSRPVYDGNREDRVGFDMTYRWGTAP